MKIFRILRYSARRMIWHLESKQSNVTPVVVWIVVCPGIGSSLGRDIFHRTIFFLRGSRRQFRVIDAGWSWTTDKSWIVGQTIWKCDSASSKIFAFNAESSKYRGIYDEGNTKMICTAPTVFLFTFGISCVIGSGLHERCDTDEDCGTIDTYCSNKICACKEHFAVFYDSCVPLAQPRIRCTDRNQCQEVMGIRSMCTKKRQCVCKPFHHLHLGQCVKNRDLHDICEHDHQCYCGAGCENKIACIGRNCTCKHGHRPYRSRQCIISDDVLLPTTTDVHTSPSPTSATPSLTTPITQYPANETFVDNSCRLFRSFSFLVYVPIVIINFWK